MLARYGMDEGSLDQIPREDNRNGERSELVARGNTESGACTSNRPPQLCSGLVR